jgi:hypothetical protein
MTMSSTAGARMPLAATPSVDGLEMYYEIHTTGRTAQ